MNYINRLQKSGMLSMVTSTSENVDFVEVLDYNKLNKLNNEMPDRFKVNPDIPENRAFMSMGLAYDTLLNARERYIKADHDTIVGGMDRAHFSEMCIVSGGALYRLEMKSGREVSKHVDMFYLQRVLRCSFQDAHLLAWAFGVFEIGKKELNVILFSKHIGLSILNPIDKKFHDKIIQYVIVAGRVMGFELKKDVAVAYVEDPQEQDQEQDQDQDVFDTSLYTAKRLSSGYESLSHEAINKIRFADFETYKDILSKFRSEKFNGMRNQLTDSEYSQGWEYLKIRGAYHRRRKEMEMKKAAAALPLHVFQGIKNFKKSPTRLNKYYLTICAYGGVWDSVEIKKADKAIASVIWQVIAGKM